MKPVVLNVLLALSDADRHGYAIMQEVARYSDGSVRLLPGALYRAIKEMADEGLIEESGDRPAPELDDVRRRYYRVTPSGRDALAGELSRLDRLVREGRRKEALATDAAVKAEL